MNCFKVLIIIIPLWNAVLLPKVVEAQETPILDPDEVIARLRSFSEGISSIRCEFKQVKTITFVKDPLVSTGQFFYSAPDKIRWEQTEPQEYIMLIAGDGMKVKKNGKEKHHDLRKSQALAAFRDILLGIISGDILLGNQFSVAYFETNTDYVLNLTPHGRAAKQQFSRIGLSFNKSDMSLKTISLMEDNGDSTLISFINPVFNERQQEDRYIKF